MQNMRKSAVYNSVPKESGGVNQDSSPKTSLELIKTLKKCAHPAAAPLEIVPENKNMKNESVRKSLNLAIKNKMPSLAPLNLTSTNRQTSSMWGDAKGVTPSVTDTIERTQIMRTQKNFKSYIMKKINKITEKANK